MFLKIMQTELMALRHFSENCSMQSEEDPLGMSPSNSVCESLENQDDRVGSPPLQGGYRSQGRRSRWVWNWQILKIYSCCPPLVAIRWWTKLKLSPATSQDLRSTLHGKNQAGLSKTQILYCQAQPKPASQYPAGGWDSLNLKTELIHPPTHHPPRIVVSEYSRA